MARKKRQAEWMLRRKLQSPSLVSPARRRNLQEKCLLQS